MIDFLVIGGGIAGISVAARLSHLGQTTVLEREFGLAYHASGRSAAMFEKTYGHATAVTLNLASHAYHRDANGGVLSPRGLMIVGAADSAEDFKEINKNMAMDSITLSEAHAMIPILNTDTVDRVGYHAEAWDIDTDLLIQNFAREVRGNGGQVLTKSEVIDITRISPGWRVTTPTESYEARTLVNAAGAWVDEIAILAGVNPLGVTPLRRSMARIPAPGGHDVSTWPMLYGSGVEWYAKADAGALIVSPAEQVLVPSQDAYPDDLTLAEGLARYEAHVTEPVTRLLASWAGLRTFAPDRALVLGADPADAQFIWVACQGGCGFQTAPAASQLVADLIAGKPPEIDAKTVQAISPQRFS